MTHVCGNCPTHDPHVTHDPPRCAFNAGRGEAQRTNNYYGKNMPHLPAHRSGPGPTTRRAYVWPRPGGSYRCTKIGAHLCTPFSCARAVRVAPTATPSRMREVSQGKIEAQDNRSNTKAKTTKSRGMKQVPPARPLPGQRAPLEQREPPLSPRSPTPSSMWGQGSGRHLCGGIQIFVKTYSRSDED